MRRAKKQAESVSKQQVRSMIRNSLANAQELKVYDISSTGNSFTTAGSVSPVTQGIVQGDSIVTRDGDVLQLKQVTINVNFTNSSTTSSFRIIVFRDLMDVTVAGAPVVNDVIQSVSYISGYNIVNQQIGRFKIMEDNIYPMVSVGSSGVQRKTFTYRGDWRVTYRDLTNISAANGPGAWYVLFIAANALGTFDFNFHLRFTDS